MTQNRFYANAPPSTLAADLGAVTPGTSGSVEVTDNTGWPAQFPFTLLIDWGSGSFEAATVTQAATGTGPYTYANTIRGDDSTLAPAHSSGAQAVPGVSARDFTEASKHVNGFTSGMAPSGITGATAASRYVGATASGAPASGTFAVGDFVVDRSGAFWVCTAAGSPGTWAEVSGGGGGSGTVTSVTVESANGLAGTVASGTTTPQVTLSTTVTGLLKGNGTAISAAAAGTDYLAPGGNGSALTGLTQSQISGLAAALALLAPLASPALTGTPTAPTQTTGDSSTKVATDAFVSAAVAAETTRAETAEALLAPLASPALTGSPTAPTKTALTNSTDVATTAYADAAVAVETARAEAAEALALPKAGGTLAGWLAPAVVALTFGATIAVNAALGNVFTLTLTASTGTISNPTNPVDGQVIRFRVSQDATGSRTVAWGTAYDWGSTGGSANSAPTLTTTASKTDTLAFEYDAAISKWTYLAAAWPQGF